MQERIDARPLDCMPLFGVGDGALWRKEPKVSGNGKGRRADGA